MSRAAAVLICLVFLGCNTIEKRAADHQNNTDNPGTTVDTGHTTDHSIDSDTNPSPTKGCDKMDILFVIDDSGSMKCEQEMLTQAFPKFIEVIENYNNANAQSIKYRVGVTSTGRSVKGTYVIKIPGFPEQRIPFNEKGMDGKLAEVNGFKWIDGPNDPVTISEQFTELATLGTGGPTYEMPLESMRLMLDKTVEGEINEGFLRPNSLFIAVVITDEDDCSRTDNNFEIPNDNCMAAPLQHNLVDLSDYREELETRFGKQGYVFVSIAGKDGCMADEYPITCEDDDDQDGADGAERLYDFTSNYCNEQSRFSDICSNSMSDALMEAMDNIEFACDDYTPPI